MIDDSLMIKMVENPKLDMIAISSVPTMNQSTLVSRRQSFCDLPRDTNNLLHLERTDALDLVVQSLADDAFHDQIRQRCSLGPE